MTGQTDKLKTDDELELAISYYFIDEIKDGFIRGFRTLANLKEYACKAADHELLGKIKVGLHNYSSSHCSYVETL